jgi:predicted TIM-barrel fold metal-dependent hydrolase
MGKDVMKTPLGAAKFFSRCVCCQPTPASSSIAVDRRRFLAGGIAAAGFAASAVSATPTLAQGAKQRIDVHHHVVPPAQIKAAAARGKRMPKWSVEKSIEDMDKGGVATSVISIINPGPWYGKVDPEMRTLARECNEFCAQLGRDHPGRFRFFAAIPLPDTEGSLKEIEYAYDTRKAEGLARWTNYTGKYLGDESFVPVYEELNRRKAVIYTHPTVAECCSDAVPNVGASTIEYATDTTRTVASMFFEKAGVGYKFPDIRWIWSHSGGTIPLLTSRFTVQARRLKRADTTPYLEKFFYEIAQGNTPEQLAALLKMVKIPQVMFGSDYPYRKASQAADGLAAYPFTVADRQAIDYGNAMRIMPTLKKA